MKSRLLEYNSLNKLFHKNDELLLAISGGIDSMVLLDLFYKAGVTISLAHCNFGLRGEESDLDEAFIRSIAKKYKIKLFVKQCNTLEYARINKKSIQESARELRYNWFNKLLFDNEFDKIAVAHHFDDNLETFFINFSRGSGLNGLKGIPIINGNIIRPLMCFTRSEIEEYSNNNNLEYREDSSNKSDKYLRNNIRHKLIPTLSEVIGKSNSIKKSMSYLAEDNLLFNQLMNEKRDALIDQIDNNHQVTISKLLSLSPIQSWTYYLLKPYNFSRIVCDEISNGLQILHSGKTFFSSTHRLIIDRNLLIISKLERDLFKECFIEEQTKTINYPIKIDICSFENTKEFKIDTSKHIAYFDFNKLKFPLKIRRWEKGDKFKPLGMKGSKLVSDYFIDEKLNLAEKENVNLILSGEDIIWIVGFRTSDKYKLSDKTKFVYQITQK